MFDKDGDGTISLAEFLDTMSEFSKQGHMEKIMFLFKIYDIDGERVQIHHGSFSLSYHNVSGNGTLQLNELEDVMRACMKESGMKLPESDVQVVYSGHLLVRHCTSLIVGCFATGTGVCFARGCHRRNDSRGRIGCFRRDQH